MSHTTSDISEKTAVGVLLIFGGIIAVGLAVVEHYANVGLPDYSLQGMIALAFGFLCILV